MKLLALFFIALFSTNVVQADFVKARGAHPRKHFANPSQLDIDDLIRAEEDPNFLQYLKDREHQKKLDEAAALDYLKQRQAEAAAYEKARLDYIKNKKVVPDNSEQEEEQYRKEQRALWQQKEKYRREYVLEQQKEEKLKLERMARLQKLFSQERMPASEK